MVRAVSIGLALLVATAAGCVATTRAPAPATVKVDAQSWSEGASPEAIEQLKQQRVRQVEQVLAERQESSADSGQPPSREAPNASSTGVQGGGGPASPAPHENIGPYGPSHAYEPVRTSGYVSSTPEPDPLPRSRPIAIAGSSEGVSSRPAGDLVAAGYTAPPAAGPTTWSVSEAALPLSLKGIVAGRNTRFALLSIPGTESMLAREGDRIHFRDGDRQSQAVIVGIDDNSVRVQLEGESMIRVLR